MSCIKHQVIFKEGELNKNVYFVKSGELLITKRVQMPKLDEEMEDTQKIFEDPSYIREMQKKQDQAPKKKQHIVGMVSQGQILGIDEANFGYSTTYNTGAICKTLDAELFYIDREFLSKMLSQYPIIWN